MMMIIKPWSRSSFPRQIPLKSDTKSKFRKLDRDGHGRCFTYPGNYTTTRLVVPLLPALGVHLDFDSGGLCFGPAFSAHKVHRNLIDAAIGQTWTHLSEWQAMLRLDKIRIRDQDFAWHTCASAVGKGVRYECLRHCPTGINGKRLGPASFLAWAFNLLPAVSTLLALEGTLGQQDCSNWLVWTQIESYPCRHSSSQEIVFSCKQSRLWDAE